MHVLKVQLLVFGEEELKLIVRNKETHECSYFSVLELFHDDQLLAKFSPTDIRLISCFASDQKYEADCRYLETIRYSHHL